MDDLRCFVRGVGGASSATLREAPGALALGRLGSLALRGAICALVLAAWGTSAAHSAERELLHVRVMWVHDPARQAAVSWSTAAEGRRHEVYYDTRPRGGRLDAYAHRRGSAHSGPFTMTRADEGWSPPAWYHHALLTRLEPATTYYFVVVSDGRASRELHFTTAPDDDRPVKLVFGGDSRIGRESGPSGGLDPYDHHDRQKMNLRIAALVEEHPDLVAFAHGGDYCLHPQWRYLSPWLTDHELTITGAGRVLPIIPARGNHDRGVVFEEIFHWPGERHDFYYATPLSSRVTLLTLNTETSIAGDQRDWLDAELARQRREPGKWIVAQYHQPAYGSVKSFQQGAAQRQHWVPLFEKHQIDLVCESDHHTLKRTVPIYRNRLDPERGIVYVGDGGLGVPQRTPESRWYLDEPGMATSAHHVHLLEFGEDAIRGTAIGMDGEVLDEFVIESKAALAVP